MTGGMANMLFADNMSQARAGHEEPGSRIAEHPLQEVLAQSTGQAQNRFGAADPAPLGAPSLRTARACSRVVGTHRSAPTRAQH